MCHEVLRLCREGGGEGRNHNIGLHNVAERGDRSESLNVVRLVGVEGWLDLSEALESCGGGMVVGVGIGVEGVCSIGAAGETGVSFS